ncbi:MAG: Fe-S cluster assembly protein SufD, partial [Burkholderiaceae bacterium]
MNDQSVLTRAKPNAADTSDQAWLLALQARATGRSAVLSRPTTRDEEWRFTDLSSFAQTMFVPAPGTLSRQLVPDDIAGFTIEEAQTRLVFVDGIYAPDLSVQQIDNGIAIADMQSARAQHAQTIEAHLGHHAHIDNAYFAAQNTAAIENAAVVIVPRDNAITAPVHLLFIATQKDVLGFPRC